MYKLLFYTHSTVRVINCNIKYLGSCQGYKLGAAIQQ
jgi:hypothetical protein